MKITTDVPKNYKPETGLARLLVREAYLRDLQFNSIRDGIFNSLSAAAKKSEQVEKRKPYVPKVDNTQRKKFIYIYYSQFGHENKTDPLLIWDGKKFFNIKEYEGWFANFRKIILDKAKKFESSAQAEKEVNKINDHRSLSLGSSFKEK